jgi:WD40 repeat protein
LLGAGATHDLDDDENSLRTLAWSPDGTSLAAAGNGEQVHVWKASANMATDFMDWRTRMYTFKNCNYIYASLICSLLIIHLSLLNRSVQLLKYYVFFILIV